MGQKEEVGNCCALLIIAWCADYHGKAPLIIEKPSFIYSSQFEGFFRRIIVRYYYIIGGKHMIRILQQSVLVLFLCSALLPQSVNFVAKKKLPEAVQVIRDKRFAQAAKIISSAGFAKATSHLGATKKMALKKVKNDLIYMPAKVIVDGNQRSVYTYDNEGRVKTDQLDLLENEIWQTDSRLSYSYSADGGTIILLSEIYGDGIWLPSEQAIATFDSKKNLVTYLTQTWSGDGWKNTSLFSYSYDEAGNEIEHVIKTWNETKWSPIWRYGTYYDSLNRPLMGTLQSYAGDSLVNHSQTVYIYSENGLNVRKTDANWDDEKWVASLRTDLELDVSGNELSKLVSVRSGETWRQASRFISEYDNRGNRWFYKQEQFVDSLWTPVSQETEIYDDFGLLRTYLHEIRMNDNWVNFAQRLYDYDDFGNVTRVIYDEWSDGMWIPGTGSLDLRIANQSGSFYYYGGIAEAEYTIITGVEGGEPAKLSFSLAQNYPNPFNPTTVISYLLPTAQRVRLTVYNTLGKNVAVLADEMQDAGKHSTYFSGQGLPSGVYFYTLQVGNLVLTKKMMLLK